MRKQVFIKRAVFSVIVLAVGFWLGTSNIDKKPQTIIVDGKPVVSVESIRTAKNVLRDVRRQASSDIPIESVRFAQRVTIRRAEPGTDISDMPEAVGALKKSVTLEANLYAIVADGKPLAAFDDEKDADDALRLVKQHYERNLGKLCAESVFREDVFVDRRYVNPAIAYSKPNDAARILTAVSEKPVVHVLQVGDRAVNIARQYKISLSDLKKLNPDLNLDRLIEGDQLLIRRPRPPVTVLSKALVVKTTDVTPPSESGRQGMATPIHGKRETKLVVTYENGEPVKEDVLSQVTAWDRPPISQ